jgi:hypothetical protein
MARRMSFQQRKGSHNSGQAVLEYILVLVVVVSLILGGIYQFNRAFRVWADNYFGEYLTCLLETGEIPTLGGGDGSTSECAQAYQEFKMAQLSGGGDGSGGGGSGGLSGGSDPSASGVIGRQVQPSGDAEGSSQSRVGGAAGAGGASGTSFAVRSGGSRSQGKKGTSDEDSNGQGLSGFGSQTSASGKGRILITGAEGRPKRRGPAETLERRQISGAKPVLTEGEALKPKLIPVRRAVAQSDQAPEFQELQFGDYLRYLIIICILIAILFFIGGQAVQVSKSL